MTIQLTQTLTAVVPGVPVSFLALGGTGPYTYSVLPGGAGGTINATSGVYATPVAVPVDQALLYDTIQAADFLGAVATSQVLVGTPLLLFCEILQHELGLANGRIYLWDQKLFQPSDFDLYVAVSVATCKPFANSNRQAANGIDAEQYVSMAALLDVDIISRGPAARDRKEEVILALNSIYAQQQQEANSFYVGKLPPSSKFINLSLVDGAAIPYRFRISVAIQYAYSKTAAAPYIDNNFIVAVATDPQQTADDAVITEQSVDVLTQRFVDIDVE